MWLSLKQSAFTTGNKKKVKNAHNLKLDLLLRY